MNAQPDDVEKALSDLQDLSQDVSSNSPDNGQAHGETIVVENHRVCPFQACNIKAALSKIGSQIKAHPWQAALILGLSVVSGKLACIYCGYTVLLGYLGWIVWRKEK